jgi:hypothetical protein
MIAFMADNVPHRRVRNHESSQGWRSSDPFLSSRSIQIDQVTDSTIISLLILLFSTPSYSTPASDIFFSSQGKQGLLGNASKSQLAAVFGNDGDSDKVIRETAVRTILEKGVFHAGGGISGGSSQQNDSRCGMQRLAAYLLLTLFIALLGVVDTSIQEEAEVVYMASKSLSHKVVS